MTDWNWLYSTIGQSSAAIVAVIGGLLTVQWGLVASDRQRLRDLRVEDERRGGQVQRLEAEFERREQLISVKKCFDISRSSLTKVSVANWPSVEQFVSVFADWRLDEKLVRQYLDCQRHQRDRAEKFVSEHAGSIAGADATFEVWLSRAGIDKGDLESDYLAAVFEDARLRAPSVGGYYDVRALDRLKSPNVWVPPIVTGSMLGTLYRGDAASAESRARTEIEMELRPWKESIERARITEILREQRQEELQAKLASRDTVLESKAGLEALAVMGVLGILIPVLAVFFALTALWARIVVLVAFVTALGYLMRYLLSQVKSAAEAETNSSPFQ
ncbi:MAG: hypothetical protein ACTSYX_09045 [Candidatus Thorarchaeota archaeon]